MGVRSGKGDKGFTDLLFHKRISKDSPEVRAIGDLDELNGYLGLVRSKVRTRRDRSILERIQRTVCTIATEIVVEDKKKKKLGVLLRKEDADWIESVICDLEEEVKIESYFFLPGEGELSAILDITRAVARRAERSVVGLFQGDKEKNAHILSYLNCVSDILFIMTRSYAKKRAKRPGKKSLKEKNER